jgi:shikimate kinase
VYLVGMPGSGKSTVGRLLAERLDMAFVDLDAEIETASGRTIEAIYAESGEGTFRDLEEVALADVAGRDGAVVACGGGVVLRPRNRALLRASGRVAWIDAPADVLEPRARANPRGRPILATTDSLAPVAEERRPFYEEVAAVTVDGTRPAEEVAEAVRGALP